MSPCWWQSASARPANVRSWRQRSIQEKKASFVTARDSGHLVGLASAVRRLVVVARTTDTTPAITAMRNNGFRVLLSSPTYARRFEESLPQGRHQSLLSVTCSELLPNVSRSPKWAIPNNASHPSGVLSGGAWVRPVTRDPAPATRSRSRLGIKTICLPSPTRMSLLPLARPSETL
jgi:hypothetical protein